MRKKVQAKSAFPKIDKKGDGEKVQDREFSALLSADRKIAEEKLIQEFTPLMHYIISGMEQDPENRKDCYAEACLRLLQGIDSWKIERGPLKNWVSAVTRNTAIRFLAKEKKHLHTELQDTLPALNAGPEENAIRNDQERQLNIAISKLRRSDQELIYRKYYYLQSTEQIASELGRTVRSIEGKLYRIRKKLGEWMQDI